MASKFVLSKSRVHELRNFGIFIPTSVRFFQEFNGNDMYISILWIL